MRHTLRNSPLIIISRSFFFNFVAWLIIEFLANLCAVSSPECQAMELQVGSSRINAVELNTQLDSKRMRKKECGLHDLDPSARSSN